MPTNQWPVRTTVRRGQRLGVFRAVLGIDYYDYTCDLGHKWSSAYQQGRWCTECVRSVAYSVERFAASLGERARIGRYPHMPGDGPNCECAKKKTWPEVA